MDAELYKSVVGDGHHALSGIAVWLCKGVELLEVDLNQTRLFLQLSPRGFLKRFLHPHETAWQRPRVLKRLQLALDQQDLEITFVETEHDAVDGERRPRVLVRKGHRSAFPIAT